MATRDRLHEIIDQLPVEDLEEAEFALRQLQSWRVDPLWKMLENAPIDDEPLDEETIAALDAAQARLGRGPAAVTGSKKS